MGNLFHAIDAKMNQDHWEWEQRERTLHGILSGTILIVLVLLLWTLYLFWQFVKDHQSVASAFQAGERRHSALLETNPDIVLRRTCAGIYIVRDITADKVESARLQQIQRLESLGLLVGGLPMISTTC